MRACPGAGALNAADAANAWAGADAMMLLQPGVGVVLRVSPGCAGAGHDLDMVCDATQLHQHETTSPPPFTAPATNPHHSPTTVRVFPFSCFLKIAPPIKTRSAVPHSSLQNRNGFPLFHGASNQVVPQPHPGLTHHHPAPACPPTRSPPASRAGSDSQQYRHAAARIWIQPQPPDRPGPG